jgi:hypothetical protein
VNFRNYLNTLKIIHIALTVGQLLFAAVVFYLVYSGQVAGDPSSSGMFMMIVPFFIIAGVGASIMIFNTRRNKIRQKTDLKEKLSDYRVTQILRYALLEGPTLFALVVAIITGDLGFLYIALGIVVLFASYAPSRGRVISDLQLNDQDLYKLDDPEVKF